MGKHKNILVFCVIKLGIQSKIKKKKKLTKFYKFESIELYLAHKEGRNILILIIFTNPGS